MYPDTIVSEVKGLRQRGLAVDLVQAAGQCYARLSSVAAPTPPWDRSSYDVLVAVPFTYGISGLDAFYLKLPYSFNGGEHPRVNGGIITVEGEQWRLVSWHYADGKEWVQGQDSLETHLQHVKGFFRGRGARNDYR
jgi:hypothetical protein